MSYADGFPSHNDMLSYCKEQVSIYPEYLKVQ